MKKSKQVKEDWRGEKGKYYDYGFEDGLKSLHNKSRKLCFDEGKKQALEEFEKMIDEVENQYRSSVTKNTHKKTKVFYKLFVSDLEELKSKIKKEMKK